MKKFISANIFATAAILLVLCWTAAAQTNSSNTSDSSGGSTASSNASLTTLTTVNPITTQTTVSSNFATCQFLANNGAWNIQGSVMFTQNGSGAVSISGSLSGFNTSLNGTKHGMHIHDSGDVSNSCSKTGKHFNPEGTNHGDLNDTVRHVGDLGNVVVNSTGFMNINLVDNLLSLTSGNNHSIIDLSLVIHSDEDDLGRNPTNNNSLINGNSGTKIACCHITLGSTTPITTTGSFSSADGFQPMILTTFIYSILAAISRLFRH